ncbi:hypothetical protein HMI55_006205 [Coelomomyces lativittatus]|nr:hypothetical protein HMI55_006205 [Coelomomyces lativittatus]
MPSYKIDFHTHILPKHWPDLNKKYGYPGWIQLVHEFSSTNPGEEHEAMMLQDGKPFRKIQCNCWSPEQRIRECQTTGVNLQVLSTVPVMFAYWAKPMDTLDLARYLNDHIAQVVQEDPKRFMGLGTLPMQAPELAVPELRRCLLELGLSGIQIGSTINDWHLDHPKLEPFWKAAEELACPIFIHPWTDPMHVAEKLKPYWFQWLVGMPCDTTLAICALTMGGVLQRYPKLKICLAHGGGSFLYTLGRIDHGFKSRPDLCAIKVPYPPSHYLPQIYVDSLVHDEDALNFMIKKLGSDKILLGSDLLS